MKRKPLIAVAAALMLGAAIAVAQNDFSKVEYKDTEVAPGIHMLVGAGGNIGVLAGDDGVLLIDDQFAEMGDKLKAAVGKISDKPVRFVINTHWHGDHTGGNEKLAAAGAVIVGQDHVRSRMMVDYKNPLFGWEAKASPAGALPVLTFSDSATLHFDGQDLMCFYTPNAHTDSDAMVWLPKANVLHMGDCVFIDRYPIIDVGSGGTLDGMIAAQEKALKLIGPDTKVINGHGKLASRADVQASHDMLVQVRDRVKKLVAEKKTVDEIIAAKPLADFDATWGKGYITPELILKVAYADLSQKH
jgi:glyoxylase-like metal-dependent hydrolase (beta-lactamase superfamily II)